MNNFGELVNKAAFEIRNAIKHGYDFRNEIMSETNWSEICDWCKFPDFQHYSSIYERAINTAIYIVAVELGIEYNQIKIYIHDRIEDWWDCPSSFKIDNI